MTDTHEQWQELAKKHNMSVTEYISTLEWHERDRIAKKLSKIKKNSIFVTKTTLK